MDDLPTPGRLEHVLPTALGTEGSLKLLVLGGKLSEAVSHTTTSISAAMSLAATKHLTLNLGEACSSKSGQGASKAKTDEPDASGRKLQSRDEINTGGSTSLSSEESSGKCTKNFTLPLITTPVTPPSELGER